MAEYPPIPRALLEDLEQRFPPRYPDLKTDSDRDVWAKAGEGRVIQFLRAMYEDQNNTRIRKNP